MIISFIMIFLAIIAIIVYQIIHATFLQNHWSEGLEMDIDFSGRYVAEGDSIDFFETLSNNKNMMLPVVSLKFKIDRNMVFDKEQSGNVTDYYYRNDVMSIRPYEQVKRKTGVLCKRRGFYKIDEVTLMAQDLFLKHSFFKKIPTDVHITVYPAFVNAASLMPIFNKSLGDIQTKSRRFEDPFSYSGVRDYMIGDSLKDIHWKSSAKMNKLQIKKREYVASQNVLVFLNLQPPGVWQDEVIMEESIRIAYSLCHLFEKHSIKVDFVGNGNRIYNVHAGAGGIMREVKKEMAMITYDVNQAKGLSVLNGAKVLREKLNTELKNRYLMIVSAYRGEDFCNAVEGAIRDGVDVTWINPCSGRDKEFTAGKLVKEVLRSWKV